MVPSARTTLVNGLVAVVLVLLASPASPQSESLFDSDEILDITVDAPLVEVVRRAKAGESDTARPGRLVVNGRTFPIELAVFGKSRLRVCKIPPLQIELSPNTVAGTLFEGRKTIRLVTHCAARDTSDRYVFLEYLAYRLYGLVAEPALKVRLAQVGYKDRKGRTSRPKLAFLVEDINHAAERHQLEWLDVPNQEPSMLDPVELSNFTLFQFMIGNTDWAAVRGPAGERCCHNSAVLGDPAGDVRKLLPFDFDSSGLVNAPYAEPAVRLGLLQVTQRRYRGFCANADALDDALDRFRRRKPEIDRLLGDASLPHSRARSSARNYLNQFFKIIDDPVKVEKQIRQRCRIGY